MSQTSSSTRTTAVTRRRLLCQRRANERSESGRSSTEDRVLRDQPATRINQPHVYINERGRVGRPRRAVVWTKKIQHSKFLDVLHAIPQGTSKVARRVHIRSRIRDSRGVVTAPRCCVRTRCCMRTQHFQTAVVRCSTQRRIHGRVKCGL